MRRFFAELIFSDGEVSIGGNTAHHIANVLRLKVGEQIEVVCDQILFTLELTQVAKSTVTGIILQQTPIPEETKVKITLYQGLPKSDKMEWIIQKTTELGVHTIVPLVTERAVVKLDETKGDKKLQRWQKIAQEASEQSKRMQPPIVENVMKWQDFLKKIAQEQALTIVLWEDEQTVHLKPLLEQYSNITKINLVIGPEGGLSQKEVEEARAAGAFGASLGQRILRTETAAIVATALALYQCGDLG